MELFKLFGRDVMLKIFKHYRGGKIDCPIRLYRPEFVVNLAKNEKNKHERAKIARAAGYTVNPIEVMVSKSKKDNKVE